MGKKLESLSAGMRIPYGGNNLAIVSEELASEFESGDRLIVIQTTGDLLHVPADVWKISTKTVQRAMTLFLKWVLLTMIRLQSSSNCLQITYQMTKVLCYQRFK